MSGEKEILSEKLQQPAYIVETGSIWPFILAFLLIFVTIFFFVLWFSKFRNKKNEQIISHSLNSFELIFRDLKNARKNISEKTFEIFAIKISSAIREYVKREFKIPADFITTEEFIDCFMKLSGMDWKTIGLVGDLLKLSDIAKFSQRVLLEHQQKSIYFKACKFVQAIEAKKRKNAFEEKQRLLAAQYAKGIK